MKIKRVSGKIKRYTGFPGGVAPQAAKTHSAGRWAQLVDGGFRYLVYQHSGARHPRLDHLSRDGLILPFGHPFWQKHYPPNGWGCGCKVRGAHTLKGASVAQTVTLAAQKQRQWPALIGAAFGDGLDGIIDRAWPIWVADTLSGGSHQPALVGTSSEKLVRRLTEMDRRPASAEIMVRPGLLKGPKAARHDRKGDALPEKVWLSLPARLRRPQAVLLDVESGRILYILPPHEKLSQLAMALDYRIRKPETDTTNMIVSACLPVALSS